MTTHQLIDFFESLPFVIWISVISGIGVILEIIYHITNWHIKRKKRFELNIDNDNDGEETVINDSESEILLSSRRVLFNPNDVCRDFKYQSILAFIFCFTSSIIGVQTPILGKSMSLLLRDTIEGKNQFNTPYPYILGGLFVFLGKSP